MDMSQIKELYRRLHVPELTGIAAACILAVISLIPTSGKNELHQLSVVQFFFAIFAVRLVLFVCNLRVQGTEKETLAQAKMMFVTAIVLLLMHSTSLVALMYQMFYKQKNPILASQKILAIAYGVYAIGKIVMSIYHMRKKRKENLYAETLSYIGWVSAIYTMALFTNYLLIANGAYDFIWPKYIMIAAMGLTIIVMAVVMLVRSLRIIRGRS